MTESSLSFEQFLSIRNAYAPSFHPLGRRVAFISDLAGVPQAWATDLRGGWPTQLTYLDERVSVVEYAPKGDALVVAMDRGGSELHQLYWLPGAGGRLVPLTDRAPEAIHAFGAWSPDGWGIAFASNRRNPTFFDVYVQEVPGGQPRMVYQQDGNNGVTAWSPDGRHLVVSRANTLLDNDLFLLDLDTGKETHLTPHQDEAAYHYVRWAPDSGGLYLTTNAGREFLGLAYLDVASHGLTFLAEPPWDVEGVALSPSGRRVAYTVNDGGYARLRLRDVRTGEEREVGGVPPGTFEDARYDADLTWSPDGRRLAFTLNGPKNNPDVWVHDVVRGSVRQVTFSPTAGVSREVLATPELVHFPTFDGRSIPAWLYTPSGARPDGTLPAIVDVHGGPEAQERPTFNPTVQYLVHRGYVVLAPNVRGSTGYGKSYTHLDDVRRRMDSVRDLKHAWEWLVTSGWAQPRRIAVMGGSYGGFMCLAAVTMYPELWAAGVGIVGIANLLTFLQNTGPWRRRLRAAEYGDPECDTDFLREASPIHYVDRIRAPLFVVHGANDPRVPVGEAEQIVGALRERGQPVEYLRFEDEGHGLGKRANRLKAYPAIADFLDRYVRGQ